MRNTINIPILNIDRAKGEAQNVLGMIKDKTVNVLYRLGTKHEIISTLFL